MDVMQVTKLGSISKRHIRFNMNSGRMVARYMVEIEVKLAKLLTSYVLIPSDIGIGMKEKKKY